MCDFGAAHTHAHKLLNAHTQHLQVDTCGNSKGKSKSHGRHVLSSSLSFSAEEEDNNDDEDNKDNEGGVGLEVGQGQGLGLERTHSAPVFSAGELVYGLPGLSSLENTLARDKQVASTDNTLMHIL